MTALLSRPARTGVVWLVACGLTACPAKEEAPAPEPEATPASPPTASTEETDRTECFPAFDDSSEAETVTAGGQTFERRGTVLTARAEDDDERTVLGVLGNIKEYSEANEEALSEYVRFFEEKEVDAVVVTGDIGESEADIRQALADLTAVGVPVFAIIGNRENVDDFEGAVEAVEGALSLDELRLVKLDDHALVSVPGYHDADYVHAERGCVYDEADLAEVEKAIDAADGQRVILVSHGPPRQSGDVGIDIMSEGDHVGDPALGRLVEKTGVKFVLASNIQEAGGRGTNPDGTTEVKPGDAADALFFNPGGADRTVAWQMRSGEFAHGMAAVVTYEGAQASYEVLKLPGE
jgi:Icc-related predicted phosphoesterase